jgi:hypothetical protein
MTKVVTAVSLLALAATGCSRVSEHRDPRCEPDSPTVLIAESVQTASLIPCVRSLPAGWGYGLFQATDHDARFRIETAAGPAAGVDVELVASCPPPTETASPDPTEPGTTVEKAVEQDTPYRATWTYRFEGGCVAYRIALAGEARAADLIDDLERGLSFIHRARLRSLLERQGAPAISEPPVHAS